MEGSNLKGESRNEQTVNFWNPKWSVNTRKNGPLVYNDFRKENMKKWGYPDGISLDRLPKRIGRVGIVIAGGASLNWVAPHLKRLTETGMDVVCGVSTLSVCAHHGVVPLCAVTVDANPVVLKEQIEEWLPWIEEHQIPLVCTPCADPTVLKRWPGPRWWHLPEQIGVPIFDAMPAMFPEITCRIMNGGCVVNTQMQVADILGFEYVLTAGVDFGFTEGMYGATLYHPDGSSWERHHYLTWNHPLRMMDDGTYTTEEMLSYRMNFHLVVRLDYIQVIRLTEGGREAGILREIPKVNVDEVREKEDLKRFRLKEEEICKRCEKYLDSQHLKLCINEKKQIQLVYVAAEDETLLPMFKNVMEDVKKKTEEKVKQVNESLQPKKKKEEDSGPPPPAGVARIKVSEEQLKELISGGLVRPYSRSGAVQQAGDVQPTEGEVATKAGGCAVPVLPEGIRVAFADQGNP